MSDRARWARKGTLASGGAAAGRDATLRLIHGFACPKLALIDFQGGMAMRAFVIGLTAAGIVFGAAQASAAVLPASFQNLTGSQTLPGSVNAGDLLAWSGLFADQAGSLTNEVAFKDGATNLDLSAAWFVKNNTRLVGVNIDLLDSSNTVLATDTFDGLSVGIARSSLTFAGLVAGQNYKLLITGNSITNGNYDVKVDFTPIPAAASLMLTALGGLAIVRYRRRT
jgi:hypothetical protein